MLAASAAAQPDYTFTNNNVIPFSLNPALAGNANAMRFGLNYRKQWPTLDNNYTTTRISYDQNFYKQVSSVAASFTRDNEANVFKKNEIAVAYSHNIRLQDEYFVRLGLQMALNMNYASTDLTFDDSYTGEGKDPIPSNDDVTEAHCNFLDFAFGAAFVMENKFTLGASVYHIGQPNNGFDDKEASQLGRRYVVHANYIHDLESRSGLWGRRDVSGTYLFGSANYQQQSADITGNDDNKRTYRLASLNIGCMTNPVIFGVADKYDFTSAYNNLNVLSFMVGGNYKGLQAYYIFDLYTSKKDNGSWSHEFALVYVLPPKHYRYSCPIVYW